MKIGIIALSSKVPHVEFDMGLDKLRSHGFEPEVHPQVFRSHWFFAGTDSEKARAFFEFAKRPDLSVLWCARGGYGSMRILPLLDRLTREQGPPPCGKLLVGYSDSTAVASYVQKCWGWSVLHAPMPGLKNFCSLSPLEWKAMEGWVRGQAVPKPWGKLKLRFVGKAPSEDIEGRVVGGNLTVWTSLLGTPYSYPVSGKLVFFEDVDEPLYRLDRMVQQLLLSGSLRGCKGIVLGNFLRCTDQPSRALKKAPSFKARARVLESPKPSELQWLRKPLDPGKMIPEIFAQLGDALGVPVAQGLPVGHGPGHSPLPLGAGVRLTTQGRFEIVNWDWIKHGI